MNAPSFRGFEILEVMPQGAMGTVYKARQISLDRVVAIKMLPPDLAADSADIDQFLSEARITANLKHQNIVQVYDFGKTDEGIYYFVMEFVSGYSVGEWIRRKGFLAEENALLVAESVAEALEYAWDKDGVIHCDIKPDNIMIDGDGTVKVADLGLAKSMNSVVDCQKTAAGIVCGTPNYISPEQSRGDIELDQRTDIYSLGAMLYHCMTGKMPFGGEPLIKVMDLQITDQIPDPQDINPSISTEAAWLIERMMAKNREHRQPDWKAVIFDIQRVANHKMPTILPAQGQSTVRRSMDRGKRQHAKVPVVKRPKTEQLRSYSDNAEFENMERKFELKQKQRVMSKMELLFAAAIGIAIIALAGLVIRSTMGRTKTKPAQAVRPAAVQKVGAEVSPSAIAEAEDGVARYQDEQRRRNAGQAYQSALDWVRDNPRQHAEAMALFQKVAEDGRGTEYADMARAEIEMHTDALRRAADGVIRALEAQAGELEQAGSYEDAARLFEDYDGAMARETADARRAIAQKWRGMQRQAEQAEREASAQLKIMILETAAALANGDLPSAIARVRDSAASVKSEATRSELAGLEAQLAAAAGAERRILASFAQLKGREATISLTTGQETLTIRSVHEDRIEAEKIVVIGAGHASHPRTIRAEDLAPEEKLRRLGSDDSPGTALMKGLILVQAGNLADAEQAFAAAGPLLAAPLVAELRRRQKAQIEDSARQNLAWLLRALQVEIPEELPSVHHCVAAVTRRRFSEEDSKMAAKGVDAYRSKFGGSDFATEYEPVLSALDAAARRAAQRAPQPAAQQPPPEPPRREEYRRADDESVRNQLVQKNPGVSHEHVRFASDSAGRIVAVEIYSPALRDIEPLAALAELRAVKVFGRYSWEYSSRSMQSSSLSDISALKGKPLEELSLFNTDVRDLSALAGMPLKKLNLARTKIQDLQPLAGMQLTELDISGTAVRDLRALQGMPLEQLILSGVAVDNILPLRDMKLSVLDLSGTKVRQITLLRGMPLSSLNLNDTGVGEVSSLAGMPLSRLEIARTQVRDLSPLAGMQLESLNIEGISTRSLAILKGMPLRSLTVANTRTTDLSPLSDMPLRFLNLCGNDVKDISTLEKLTSIRELFLNSTKVDNLNSLRGLPIENLTIRDTPVKDLSPLAGMPLKRLDITGTAVRDLSPIQYLPIEHLNLDPALLRQYGSSHTSVGSVLRGMRNLKTINGMRPFDY